MAPHQSRQGFVIVEISVVILPDRTDERADSLRMPNMATIDDVVRVAHPFAQVEPVYEIPSQPCRNFNRPGFARAHGCVPPCRRRPARYSLGTEIEQQRL